VGLAQTLAIEGRDRGIRVNAIAPLAASRLTASVLPPALLDRLAPEHVVPLLLLLASDACPANGQVFEAGGGRFARLRWERSRVLACAPGGVATPEALLRDWSVLDTFAGDDHPASVADGFALAERNGPGTAEVSDHG